MNLFNDILKGLPENAVLRGKLRDCEARCAAVEAENASLKDDLREARAQIKELKDQLQKSSEIELDENATKILRLLGHHGHAFEQELGSQLQLPSARIKFYLNQLADQGPCSIPKTELYTASSLLSNKEGHRIRKHKQLDLGDQDSFHVAS